MEGAGRDLGSALLRWPFRNMPHLGPGTLIEACYSPAKKLAHGFASSRTVNSSFMQSPSLGLHRRGQGCAGTAQWSLFSKGPGVGEHRCPSLPCHPPETVPSFLLSSRTKGYPLCSCRSVCDSLRSYLIGLSPWTGCVPVLGQGRL